MSKCNLQNKFICLGLPILLFLVLNILVLNLKYVIDFTEDRMHSFSPSTKDYLRGLEDPVALNLFFTGSNGNIPFKIRTHHARVVDTLEKMEKLSDGKLTVTFSDPSQDAAALEKVKFDGLTELLFAQGKNNYFGLTARCLTKNSLIPYLHPERKHLLEYDLLLLLDQINSRQRERVGLISGLPVTGTDSGANEFPPWLFVRELERSYEIVNYSKELPSLKTHPPDVLIVIHPIGFGADLERSIDAYLQNGGQLIVAVDPHCITPTFLTRTPGEEYMDMASSGLPILMKAWGVLYASDSVVGDMNFSSEINRGYGNELLHTVLTVPNEVINEDHSITRGIDNLGFAFSGFFNMKPDHPWDAAVPLVFSSMNSAVVPSEDLHLMTRKENLSLINRFVADGKPKALVVELKGKVPSAFSDTAPPASSKPARIILIGDSDFIFDAFAGEAQQVGKNQSQINPYNGNIALLSNAVDALLNRSTLTIARNRSSKRQPLTELGNLRASIVADYQNERAHLESEFVRLKQEKDGMHSHHSDKTVDEQILLNQRIKDKDAEIEKNQHRQNQLENFIEKDTSSLIAKIQWINILTVPILVILTGTICVIIRTGRTRAR